MNGRNGAQSRGKARGRNRKQRFIYGRENINWEGPTRASEDQSVLEHDLMNISRDFTEATNRAAYAKRSGDHDEYKRMLNEAASIYAAHRRWAHFAQSYPEKERDVNRWRSAYRRFRDDVKLTDEHHSAKLTDRYKLMSYRNEDWDSAVDGVHEAIWGPEKAAKDRQRYQDRVHGDRQHEPPNARYYKDDEEYNPEDYRDYHSRHGDGPNDGYGTPEGGSEYDDKPNITREDYQGLHKMMSVIQKGQFQRGTVFQIGNSDREQKIINALESWGIVKHQGGNSYALDGDEQGISLVSEEIEHRANGGQPRRAINGGRYMDPEDGEHAFQKRPHYSNSVVRGMVVDDNTISVPHGSDYHTDPEVREKFIMNFIKSGDIPYSVNRIQVEETGEVIHIDPNGRLASFQRFRKGVEKGKRIPENVVKGMKESGFLPQDYSRETDEKYYSNGRLSKNKYSTSATQVRDQNQDNHDRPWNNGGQQQYEKNGRSYNRNDHGYWEEDGQSQQRGTRGKRGKIRQKTPFLQRTARKIEDTIGLNGFGSTRMTGRKRVGPFVVNTGLGGVAGISSISLDVGPMMWSLWSKNYKSGFSSMDLPGMFSYRGKRQRKR